MAISATITQNSPGGDVEFSGKFFRVFGSITFSGSYATGGDTFDLTAITKPLGTSGIPGGYSGATIPLVIYIQGINGYSYSYVKGTTRANGKIKVSTTANTELAAGAYPAGVTGDTVVFEGLFPAD